MPSYPRLIVPDMPLHITQRGVDRCATFLVEEDFAYYLWVLEAASVAADCAVHAYVLMTNHVHLLLTPADAAGPARLMRTLGIRYVRNFNQRYRRTGTLWEGRYRSTIVDSNAYFLACSRYIERNPQRAGIADDPAAYPWSSYRCNASGVTDRIITAHPLYTALGEDRTARCSAYRQLFATELSPSSVAVVRTAPLAPRMLSRTSYQEAVAALSGTPTDRSSAPHAGA